jgi:hypothetical protein
MRTNKCKKCAYSTMEHQINYKTSMPARGHWMYWCSTVDQLCHTVRKDECLYTEKEEATE